MFVRLMRDRGFNTYRQDSYCENLFAISFNIEDSNTENYELLTTFEVFEHLEDPITEIKKMFQLSDSILFSTLLQPNVKFKSINDWWYFLPYSGQHISLYSKESLIRISKIFNCNLYSNHKDLHLLTKRKFLINPVLYIYYFHKILDKIFGKNFLNSKSLIPKDVELIKNKKRSF